MPLHYRVFVRHANLRGWLRRNRAQFSRAAKTKEPETRTRAPDFPLAELRLDVLVRFVLMGSAPSARRLFLQRRLLFDSRHRSGGTTVEGTGMLGLKGAVIKLNGGTQPLATVGSQVQILKQAIGQVTTGSATILGNYCS